MRVKVACLVIAAGTTSAVAQVGACCFSSGVCQLSNSAACSSAGGVFRGQNTLCGNCPQLANRWGEQDDAGSRPNSAQMTMGSLALISITGSLNSSTDVDMYVIQICDPDTFSAETTTGPGTVADTQLFLFLPSGVGLAFNDDLPAGGTNRSRLSNTFIGGIGAHYLAISSFDSDPVNIGGNEIWLDQPYTTERPPDGPGALNPINSWTSSGEAGTYTITLGGSCFGAPRGWAEEFDAGDLVATAQAPSGTGVLNTIAGAISSDTDADVYRIILCSPASFSAETVIGPGTLNDTQLFLFHPSGVGIASNDDDSNGLIGNRSRLSNGFTSNLAAGPYLLAVSGYDRDPRSSGDLELWLDTPYYNERAPDGPGAGSPLAFWSASPGNFGSYVIRLGGVCYSNCYANCDNSTTAPILNANDFVCFLTRYAAGCS
jgi:hypothetical protein